MTPLGEFRDCYSRALTIARDLLQALEDARDGIEASYLASLETPGREMMKLVCSDLHLATPGAGIVPPADTVIAKGILAAAQAARQARLEAEMENLRIYGEARAAALRASHETIARYGAGIERTLSATSNFAGPCEQMAPRFQAALMRPSPSGIMAKLKDGEAAEAHSLLRHAPRSFQNSVDAYCEALRDIRDPYSISAERLTQVCIESNISLPRNVQASAENAAIERLLEIGKTADGRLYLSEQMARVTDRVTRVEAVQALEHAAIARLARGASSALLGWQAHRTQYLSDMATRMLAACDHWPEYLDAELDIPGFLAPFVEQQEAGHRMIEAAWAVAALSASVETRREIVANEGYGAISSINMGVQLLSLVASKDPKAAYAIGLSSMIEPGVASLLQQTTHGKATACLSAFEEGRSEWLAQFSGADNASIWADRERQRGLNLRH